MIDDLECARNGLFLVEGLQEAYNKQWLGFPKDDNKFNDRTVLKVYNPEECSKLPLFNGSPDFVGDYDGFELQLKISEDELKHLQTALYLHAMTAFAGVSRSEIPDEKDFSIFMRTVRLARESIHKAAHEENVNIHI